MRDICFKGKQVTGAGWIEGDLIHPVGSFNPFIMDQSGEQYEVYHDSVCQRTGLLDVYGEFIYEGSIIRYENEFHDEFVGVVRFGKYETAWSCGKTHLGFYIDWVTYIDYRPDLAFWSINRQIEVISHVYDHSHILERRTE